MAEDAILDYIRFAINLLNLTKNDFNATSDEFCLDLGICLEDTTTDNFFASLTSERTETTELNSTGTVWTEEVAPYLSWNTTEIKGLSHPIGKEYPVSQTSTESFAITEPEPAKADCPIGYYNCEVGSEICILQVKKLPNHKQTCRKSLTGLGL